VPANRSNLTESVSTHRKSMRQATRLIAVAIALLWSAAAPAQDLVHFPSYEDNGPGRSSTVLDGYLLRPAAEGRHPAVIFLHGCGGLFMRGGLFGLFMRGAIEPGELDWAGQLTRRGYAVLMVDSFGPRNHGEMCSPSGFDLQLYRNRARDAYGALLFLQAQPFVQPDRVGLIGWSQGGGDVLFAIGTPSFARPTQRSRRRSPPPSPFSVDIERGSSTSHIYKTPRFSCPENKMTIYFLQPFPETRPLGNQEAHVFKEEGGGIFIINGVYQNREDALYCFGKRLGVTLSFEGSAVVPDYYFTGTQLANAPGCPKFDTHVYIRR